MWQWREQYGSTIIEQYKRLGASVDYDDERFTLDDAYVKAVLHVFVDLFEKGQIYRDNRMVNWDPGTRSAISDLEVEEREVTDTLYHVDYPLESGRGSVTVATVRPETMLADTAIAVHPDDDRYTRLVGETAILPIVGRRLKIIADPYVKPEFGTGALKITPGHDPNDFEIGRSHGLEEITVIGEDGRMTAEAGEPFAGMTVLEAREAVVAALREEGRIARTEPHTHNVPHSHRSGERIEPLISLQWFMDMERLVKPAIEAVTSGRVRIHPASGARVYLQWMENIRPWCISRQLWWGHQIPVWYRGEEVYCGTEPPAGEGWERDPDVLDTWFSSGLWPFATLGWPHETPQLRAFYPTDVLTTGREILFLWVARMVMFGLEYAGDVPFTDVYLNSIIQAPDGRRMSKSLGTGIDPLALIEGGPRPPVFEPGGEFPAYGADAVRFGLMAMSSSQDVRFNEDKVAQGRQLANKLWNASRLVLLRVPEGMTVPAAAPAPVTVEDAWILSRLQDAKATMAQALDEFEFHHAVARPLRLRLRRAVRLVPRADQAAALRRGQPRGRRGGAARARRDAGARAPGDPVRHRGDLVVHSRGRGPADGRPLPRGRRAACRPFGRGRDRPRDRRRAGAAGVARSRARGARDHDPGPPRGHGLRAHRRAGGAAGARRSGARTAASRSPACRSLAARCQCWSPGPWTRRPRPSAPRSGARGFGRRSSARRASSPTRASSPRRRRPSSRPSARSSSACGPSSGRSRERGAAP